MKDFKNPLELLKPVYTVLLNNFTGKIALKVMKLSFSKKHLPTPGNARLLLRVVFKKELAAELAAQS